MASVWHTLSVWLDYGLGVKAQHSGYQKFVYSNMAARKAKHGSKVGERGGRHLA